MSEPFAKEDIPNIDSVFYRVHKQYIVEGNLIPAAFQTKGGDGMSVDWDKYSTAEQSLALSKMPQDNSIVKFLALEIRNIDKLELEHDPIDQNQSHSLVLGLPEKGEFKTRIRAQLKQIAQWAIKQH